MKFQILMVLVLAVQIALVSSETAAQEAFKDVLIYHLKCRSQKNADIFDDDYESIDKHGVITHKREAVKAMLELSSETIAEDAEMLKLLKSPFFIAPFEAEFTRDGMLFVKIHLKGELRGIALFKRDSSVEGGYKVYREIEIS